MNKKSVLQYDLDGNFIKEFPSCKECATLLKIPISSISDCCNGKLLTAKGHMFKYRKGSIQVKIDPVNYKKRTKEVYNITTNTYYDNVTIAAKETGVSINTLRWGLSRSGKCGGFRWKYA